MFCIDEKGVLEWGMNEELKVTDEQINIYKSRCVCSSTLHCGTVAF